MGQRLHRPSKVARMWVCVTALAWILLVSGVTTAHRPLFANDNANDPNSAVRIPDPSVSHVIYVKLTEKRPHQWFVFENDEPREVPIQVGIPAAVRQGEIGPVVMLFGPGWTDRPGSLPFSPPAGDALGAMALPIADSPHRFYEPVTGTESHILVDTRVELPAAGTYYGVVYEEHGHPGKVWIGIGESEGFSWRDMSRLPGWIGDVRRFHEVSGWPRWAWMGTLGLLAVALLILAWVKRRRA